VGTLEDGACADCVNFFAVVAEVVAFFAAAPLFVLSVSGLALGAGWVPAPTLLL